MSPSLFTHLDWAKIWEGILTSAGGGYLIYLSGKRAQKWREKSETRTQDQKAIDQLIGRVGTLETQMTTANEKIEDLRTEKMELQAQIISLRKDIALLEVKKAEFESREVEFERREVMFSAQIASLQQLLAAKTSELTCAETRLKDLETK